MSFTHPPHWRTYDDPSHWFRLWHPPGWTLVESGGEAQLIAPESGGVLRIVGRWHADPPSVDWEKLVDPRRVFPHSHAIRRVKPLDIPYSSNCIEGESDDAARFPWWKRWLRPPLWRPWKLWTIRHKSVCLVATFQTAGRRDPETETLAGMIMSSLVLADEPADPPDLFAERVVRVARERFPSLDCKRCEEFAVQLGNSNINLFNFYRCYVQDPDRFEEIMLPALATLAKVQEWGETQGEPTLESVRDRILPMLYPEDVWRRSFPNFVANTWVGDLMVLYVVDEQHAYWYIRDELLDRWQIERDELHALALSNLDSYFERQRMEYIMAGEEGGPRLLMPKRPDAYNSSRILSRRFCSVLRDELGSQLAVGVPSRDFLVAVSMQESETLGQVRRKVEDDFSRMDYPLSPRLLLVSADGVSEFPERTFDP
jgi:Protein of unknown function (DUF1444)